MSLQPLVENAVLHGIAPRVKGGKLTVSARRDGEQLALRVADDGPGCDWPPATRSGSGVGLSALQRRFEIDYEGQARMQVKTAPGAGFAVELAIPL